jgi:aryl-alcohol dehydrogenase-like predicted oxidoreductase
MRTVALPGRAERVSAVGFGTAALGRRLTQRQKIRLLEEAFSLGVTYFDTAPLYGRGGAEAAVGRFAARRRDAVAIATKLGLEWSGTVRRRVVRRFDADSAQRRLETSLRVLRTDRVDVLLLHEPEPADVSSDLVEFLLGAVESGRVGAIGVGADATATAAIVADRPGFTIAQTALAQLDELAGAAVFRIAHTPLHALRDGGASGRSAPELLAAALDRNPEGIVLFGSGQRTHLEENLRPLVDG